MSPVVAARNVAKWYGPRRAVVDVSFEVEPGEIIGLLGPNGSGKSTLFRMLCGYLAPSAGSISIAGHDVATDSLAVRQAIGYLPEHSPLYDHMRVGEFLNFMASIKGLSGVKARRAIAEVAERLALGDVMKLPTRKLSRGYRQRVSIAQAILGDPTLIVLDEPTSGLDPHQVIGVRDLIRSLAERHTIILASHGLAEIEKIATRVMILLDGRLLTSDALAGTTGGTRFRLRVAGDEATVRNACSAVAGVHSVAAAEAGAGAYVIDVDGPSVAPALVAALVAGGVPVLEVAEGTTDLEQVFLDLTRQAREVAA